ncbi:FtsX-like permease family protein [Kitasatospora acidiphila]|uniref:FtsX-like permease family protein n=1 Tax=Kitasatospora acidiphila TaxID=2567942 RepID=A0A540VWY0_9ACTN|nr:ABC transporter permease [Kitasatospora acidiphila]TQF01273.1 FtsX-like permease family protein [Kitasatospora acidiphila]
MTNTARSASWPTQLLLGVRMALAGGRDCRLRTLLTAVGVGLGVTALLLAASMPAVRAHRDDRLRAQSGALISAPHADRSDHSLLMTDISTSFHGRQVLGRAVHPEGPAAPVPPGLTSYPAPGTMAVSPALAELLRSPSGKLLRDRLPEPITGTVGQAGLVGPGDYAFFLGSDQLTDSAEGVVRLDHFADKLPPKPTDPLLVLLTVAGVVILLCPVAVFLAAAVRFGGEARDRRLAALRLAGADRATTARIATGESLLGALFGLVVGAGCYLMTRQLIERFTVAGLSVFRSDLYPQPVLAAAALLAVPVLAVLVTLLTMRRIAAEPLGVVRGARTRPRRVWWRLALPATGVALLVGERDQLAVGYSTQGIAIVVIGLLLLLVGTTLLLPPLLDWAGRALRRVDGPPAWQLALARVRFSPETATRPVTGIVVTVAGAIALQTLLGAMATARATMDTGYTDRSLISAHFSPGSGARATEYANRVHGTAGVADALGYTEFYGTSGVQGVPVWVADCETLRRFAPITDCADGDVFTARGAVGPATVGALSVLDSATPWQPPAPRGEVSMLNVPDQPPGPPARTGLLATPGAVPADLLRAKRATLAIHTVPGQADADELVRTAVARLDRQAAVYRPTDPLPDQGFLSIRRALTAGTAAILALIGAGMLVGLLEQLREQRRTLAVLTAFGTRRRTLACSLLWQSGVPVLIGLALATVSGIGLAAALLYLERLRPVVAWQDVLVLTGVGAAAVLATTLLSLPALWRRTNGGGLRHE